jgi:hypothetical protein
MILIVFSVTIKKSKAAQIHKLIGLTYKGGVYISTQHDITKRSSIFTIKTGVYWTK